MLSTFVCEFPDTNSKTLNRRMSCLALKRQHNLGLSRIEIEMNKRLRLAGFFESRTYWP